MKGKSNEAIKMGWNRLKADLKGEDLIENDVDILSQVVYRGMRLVFLTAVVFGVLFSLSLLITHMGV